MVTFNGRITLPPNVRKQLGLKTGDCVEFVEIGKGRFAIASGADSADESMADSKNWIPQLDFSPTADEPRFEELDEVIH
jgi:AbrB family looped-hinge helix DNA binding protein